MIVKITTDNILFSWTDSDEDVEWCNSNKNLPMCVNAIVMNYMQQTSINWYEENIGNRLWFHLKK